VCPLYLTASSGFVLAVVRRIDGTQKKLHDPHIRTHVLPSLLHHLRLLRLVVHGLIDETTDVRVVIQRSEELLRLLVVTDLRELVGDRIWSVAGLLKLAVGIDDDLNDLVGRLAGGSTISDGNHEQRLLKRVLPGGTEQERLQDLLVESGAERGKTAELDLLDELEGGLLRVNVVPLQVGVEESDLNSVVVEQGAGESNLAEDHLEIINALAVLLERHTARVVDQDDNVEERNLDEVRSELDRETPSGRELVEHARLGDALSDLLDRPGRVEGIQVLVLDTGLQELSDDLGAKRAATHTGRSALRGTVLAWRSPVRRLVLLLTVLALLRLPVLARLLLTVLPLLRRLTILAMSRLLAVLTLPGLLAVLSLSGLLTRLLAVLPLRGLLAILSRLLVLTRLLTILALAGWGLTVLLLLRWLAVLALRGLLTVLTLAGLLLAVLPGLLLTVPAGSRSTVASRSAWRLGSAGHPADSGGGLVGLSEFASESHCVSAVYRW